MDSDEFLSRYDNYQISVTPELWGKKPRTISLDLWILSPLDEKKEHFLARSEDRRKDLWVLKIDFVTSKCYHQVSENEYVYLGTLERIPVRAQRPA